MRLLRSHRVPRRVVSTRLLSRWG